MKVSDLQSIRIKVSSPEDILGWSNGEVKKPETINYRTQRPEKDGLFCEKIFGPSKDYECYCGKYKGIRYKNVVCDRCGVEIIRSSVRRERMGHIKLAAPCSHIWYLRGVPSRIGLLLDIPQQKIERVIYFASYIIENVDKGMKKKLLEELADEAKKKTAKLLKEEISPKKRKQKKEDLAQDLMAVREEIKGIEEFRVLSEVDYRDLASKYGEIFTAGTGAESILGIFKKIDIDKEIDKVKKGIEAVAAGLQKKNLRRLKFIQGMKDAGIKPEWLFLQVLPVLPSDLRPMVQLDGGRYASSDLNDLYRRVINRNNRLKYLIEISAPEVIIRNEKRMLQEAVDSLFDNGMRKTQMTTASTGGKRTLKSLADILSGKQGRFRRNLLGKRVDYSARSVITPGSELKLSQCGLPKIMGLELFRPFIIKELLDDGMAFNIRGASRLIDEGVPEVFAALETVAKDKLLLLNRAPTLHRLGIQAFRPILTEGESIKIHPLVCKAFNADFDGDQMAVHLPLSKEAQDEAKNLMLSTKNFLKPASGLPVVSPTQDIILGCYFLTGAEDGLKGEGTGFSSFDNAILSEQIGAIDLRAKIKIYETGKEPLETTCGLIMFNEILPDGFPWINEVVDSRKLSKIVGDLIMRYKEDEVAEALDRIKELGFEYGTLSGISLGIDDFIVPKEKKGLVLEAEKETDEINGQYQKGLLSNEEKNSKLIEIWQAVKDKLEKLVPKALPKNGPVYSIVNSGARGSWAQPLQICGMKGLVTSPSGRIIELPIKSSFKEGFDVLEFFISTHGARKGTVDTALRTSASGYLTRRLVDVSHDAIINLEDCKDTEGIEVERGDADEIGQNFAFKIVGRVSLEDVKGKNGKIVKKGDIIDWQKAEEIDRSGVDKITIRSPLNCKALRGICKQCYGWDMGRNNPVAIGEAVGVVASQSIGEPGTQLTMRTFHLGGVAGGGDITRGLPRVEELFELRGLKEEAAISLTDGMVKEIDVEKRKIVINSYGKNTKTNTKPKTKVKLQEIEYVVPSDAEIYVKKGDVVKAGQVFCSGPLDLRKLFKISGKRKTEAYIVREVQKIYVSEGIDIHDKHIEIIVRQMFSRVRIIDGGDSPWVAGEILGLPEVGEKNEILKKDNKKIAKFQSILLGISRVALTSDSFLSAASFQETSRILIKSAVEAQEDKLRGLKENVMIGRLIPAGTGFRAKK